MQEVFKHTPTGDLYAVKSGRLNRLINLKGERYLVIEPVKRLFDLANPVEVKEVPDTQRTCQYAAMNQVLAYEMIVPKAEFDSDFVEIENLGAMQNSDIEALVHQYEREGCDFSDIPWVVGRALTAAQTLRDGLSRCSLYSLAKHVESSLPEKVVLPD